MSIVNAAGRKVETKIGEKTYTPFKGATKYHYSSKVLYTKLTCGFKCHIDDKITVSELMMK
jgi:hypothetical protein